MASVSIAWSVARSTIPHPIGVSTVLHVRQKSSVGSRRSTQGEGGRASKVTHNKRQRHEHHFETEV